MFRTLQLHRMAAVVGLVVLVGLVALPLNAQFKVAFPLKAPTWYHGDHWEWKGPRGNIVVVEVESASTDGTYHLVGAAGVFAPNGEWGTILLGEREQVGNFLFIDWPLTYNKRWEDVGAHYRFVWRVGPIGTVTLPNKMKFQAVHLLCSVLTPPAGNPPVQKQVGTASAWYAPAAKTIVQIQFGPEAAWPDGVRNKSLNLVKYQVH